MNVHDQAESLRRKLAIADGKEEAKTISIISGKGGVGKSSFAVNFSLELIQHNYKVLLVDLDIGMGNIEILLGLHADRTLMDLFDQQLDIQDIIATGPKNLSYISGGSGFNHLFSLTKEQKDLFYESYNELARIYDYIIFDMGAGISEDSLFFILCSDECLLVTTPEPTALTDGYSMIKLLLKYRGNMPINIIMNRARSLREGKAALEQFKQIISRFLSTEVGLLGVLTEDKAVPESIRRQKPYVLGKSKSKIAHLIESLTATYLSEPIPAKSRKTFIQRLKLFWKEK